jgi:peptidyl-prolyl cis-trans isomerase B (cyclophilin B)
MKRLGLLGKGMALILMILVTFTAASPGDPYRAMVALESRRSLGDGQLAHLLASGDQRVALRAALAIGRTMQPAGEPLLAAHLDDPRDAVRAMTVYAIGLLATGGHAAALNAALGDPSSAVRLAATDAIARYEAAHRYPPGEETLAAGLLVDTLRGDTDSTVRGSAAIALFEFAHSHAAGRVAAALEATSSGDRDPQVRRKAMWTIFRGYTPHVDVRFVESALHDADDVVRIEAVRAIGQYKSSALAAFVKPLLADRSWRVQEQAEQTLLALSGKPFTAHWKAIPPSVHVPPREPDALVSLRALPRTPVRGKPEAPTANAAMLEPRLDPATALQMTEPAAGAHPRVRIVTTQGNLYVVLFPEWAPLTVENFLDLTNRGYYDDNPWFRIVPDFVVQTGDPKGDENGDAGFSIPAEENPLEQHSYIISMGLNYDDKTNMPERDSAGTQYYITLSPQYHLDRAFTVFGRVTGGFDVLGRLTEKDRVIRIERIPDVVLPPA